MLHHFKKLCGKILVVSLMLSTLAIGCGGSDGNSNNNNTTTGPISESNKLLARSMLFMAFAFAPLPVFTAPTIKFSSFACPNGGSIDTETDGSQTFQDCSFGPGQLFSGRIKVTPDGNGQGGSIEFDNFRGEDGGTSFEVDGKITETEQSDGSLGFQFDLRSSATDIEGQTDTTDVFGDISVDEDGNLFGGMNMKVNDLNTNCQFEGQSVFDFQDEDSADQLLEDACSEQIIVF